VHKTVADVRLEAVAVSTRPGHEPNVRFHNVVPRKPTGSKPPEAAIGLDDWYKAGGPDLAIGNEDSR
jgi:hypothetical protein